MKKLLTGVFGIGLVFSMVLGFNFYNLKNEKYSGMEALASSQGNESVEGVIATEAKSDAESYLNAQETVNGLGGLHSHENHYCGATEKGLGIGERGYWDKHKTDAHFYSWNDKGDFEDSPALYCR